MITRDTQAFFAYAATVAMDFDRACAKAAFMVAPDGFSKALQSAQDNRYMAEQSAFDADKASAEHRLLQQAISKKLPVICFAGDAQTPDAVFPNNVFASSKGRLIIGKMRHPVRQREAQRNDIRQFFIEMLNHRCIDLSQQPHPCELTGCLIIDRARGLGFIGLSERCDEEGARQMHEAFGLRASLLFDLNEGEYHTNVVLSVLASRAAVICPAGFADVQVASAIAAFYPAHVWCSANEHQNFVGNCIALTEDSVWMSARAGQALTAAHQQVLAQAGFSVHTVDLAAIEAGGGSLRCCVGEIY